MNKYSYIKVLQANYGYGHGWEDVCAEESHKEAQARLKEYRENMPEYPYRIISRRELNENS
jgi:hypothetical protein